MTTVGQVSWSTQQGGPIELGTAAELDAAFHAAHAGCLDGKAVVFEVHAHGQELMVVMRKEDCAVQISDPGMMPPYLTAIGDPTLTGDVAFDWADRPRTHGGRRYMVPIETGRAAARAFLELGAKLPGITWEE